MTHQPDLILGTAGHIDHGKSALVQALTGTDPDRLNEEKQRGITIQLGFAQLELPSGRTMGVIDVPGHERFVKQMIAGATGVDVALLVIAADDGIMPQTIEHLAVLQTLGVNACVVALTKADLVDEDWLEFVSGEVAGFLGNTPYANAPIVAVSSKTGHGLDELKAAIEGACSHAERSDHGLAARLPIDRVFTIKGAGTVVTGTLWSGSVGIGDELESLGNGKSYRVRSLQEHGAPIEQTRAGNRVALNLADASTAELAPGDFLCTPGTVQMTDRFDCTLTYLDVSKREKPLVTGSRMHVAHGTREVIGRVLFCDKLQKLGSGETAYAQIRLEEPLSVRSGDRFVVRTYSPTLVAGGGEVLLARPRRQTNLNESMHALLDALREGDRNRAAGLAVAAHHTPVTCERIATFIGDDREAVARGLEGQAAQGAVMTFGKDGGAKFYTTQPVFRKIAGSIDRALISFHSDSPAEAGMAKGALRRKCYPNMSDTCFDAFIDQLAASGTVVAREGLVGHPSAQGSAQRIVDNAADDLAALLAAQGMTPETLPYLAKHSGLSTQMASKAMGTLVEAGRAYRISNELFFDAQAVAKAKDRIACHLQAGKPGTAAALKEAMGTSRKFAMPLLERFDAEGFTKREGDVRALA